MSAERGQGPIHDPVDLLDELDSIIRAQEMLRHRTIALAARYAALRPFAARYDEPGDGVSETTRQHGFANLELAMQDLDSAAQDMHCTTTHDLQPARELASKVREYPQPQRSVERPAVDWRRSR